MSNVLEYKGYYSKIEYSREDGLLYGRIEGINDLVNFESRQLDDIEKQFHLAVEDYLDFCKELGKEPERAYKGTFNVRIKPELHKQTAAYAVQNSESLNQFVEKAIENRVKEIARAEKQAKFQAANTMVAQKILVIHTQGESKHTIGDGDNYIMDWGQSNERYQKASGGMQ